MAEAEKENEEHKDDDGPGGGDEQVDAPPTFGGAVEVPERSSSSVSSTSQNVRLSNFADLYEYIIGKVPNSKIFVIGGSDEVSRSGYKSKLFDHVIHMDCQIDVKPKFKLQLEDKDASGKLLF